MIANRGKDFLPGVHTLLCFNHLIRESSRHCSRNVRGAIGGASRQAVQAPNGGAILAMNPPTFPILPCLTTSRWDDRAMRVPHSYNLGRDQAKAYKRNASRSVNFLLTGPCSSADPLAVPSTTSERK